VSGEQRKPFALRLAITLAVNQQFGKGALPAGHRMQAGADTLPHPIAFPERLALAGPVDPAKRPDAETECQRKEFPHTHAVTRRDARSVALEQFPPPLGEGQGGGLIIELR
jgi:hypothetical protein